MATQTSSEMLSGALIRLRSEPPSIGLAFARESFAFSEPALEQIRKFGHAGIAMGARGEFSSPFLHHKSLLVYLNLYGFELRTKARRLP